MCCKKGLPIQTAFVPNDSTWVNMQKISVQFRTSVSTLFTSQHKKLIPLLPLKPFGCCPQNVFLKNCTVSKSWICVECASIKKTYLFSTKDKAVYSKCYFLKS